MIKTADFTKWLKGYLPELEFPRLGREIDLPVYLVHNSLDKEDYFFIFDFEQFVEQTRSGIFVRPKLSVWAGRDDFSRTEFARQFRQSFAREFDAARAQLAAQGEKPKGWFGFLVGSFAELRGASLSSFLANLVLATALSAGGMVLKQIVPSRWLGAKSDTTKLEENIEATKANVEDALANLDINLHTELYDHAFREGGHGKRADLQRDAWPLPQNIRSHLHDRTSSSWW